MPSLTNLEFRQTVRWALSYYALYGVAGANTASLRGGMHIDAYNAIQDPHTLGAFTVFELNRCGVEFLEADVSENIALVCRDNRNHAKVYTCNQARENLAKIMVLPWGSANTIRKILQIGYPMISQLQQTAVDALENLSRACYVILGPASSWGGMASGNAGAVWQFKPKDRDTWLYSRAQDWANFAKRCDPDLVELAVTASNAMANLAHDANKNGTLFIQRPFDPAYHAWTGDT